MKKVIDLKNKNGDKLLLNLFPVGSIYINVTPTNPKNFFGGEWKDLGPVSIIGAGTAIAEDGDELNFFPGDIVGSYKHQLTVDEIPKHQHTVSKRQGTNNTGPYELIGQSGGGTIYQFPTTNVGGDGYHNNIPKSFVAYVWLRIS